MQNIVYFDNSATTKPCEKAIEYVNNALSCNWGNPSSLHMLGINAETEISLARRLVAKTINAAEEEIFFTSGGTEANNLALIGAAVARKKRGNRIVTTAIEHPSVLETLRHLEKEGFEVIRIMPDKTGTIGPEQIQEAVNSQTVLVSIMLVNNEIGTIQPLQAAADAIKKIGAPALLHCDAVQAYGKLNINVKNLGVDLLTASGHKIHASKGIGFLYKRRGVNLLNTVYGGGQEKGLRSGTECVPLISGLRGAVEEIGNIDKNYKEVLKLWQYAKQNILDTGVADINSPDGCLPYILNISVPGYRSETLLHFLDAKGIYVSSGSACAKGQKSYVMTAMGHDNKRIDSALRLSFSRYNTKEEIDKFCSALIEACKTLRKA